MIYGGFLTWGYPQIIHFHQFFFPYQPSILGYPHLWNPPICWWYISNYFYLPQPLFEVPSHADRLGDSAGGADFGSFHVHLEKNLTWQRAEMRQATPVECFFPTKNPAIALELESYLPSKLEDSQGQTVLSFGGKQCNQIAKTCSQPSHNSCMKLAELEVRNLQIHQCWDLFWQEL